MTADSITADALGYLTAPYARGALTAELALTTGAPGVHQVAGYDFAAVAGRYGLTEADLEVGYLLTLRSPAAGPRTVEVDYDQEAGPGTLRITVPGDALPGASFVLPLPPGQLYVRAVREHPAPAAHQPDGADRWRLTALLGNTARLVHLLLAERQALAGIADDVALQHRLRTARGGSLDLIGQALGVPRLLPAPYRLDLDQHTLALYHLDDPVAPVLDATHDHPGDPGGAVRGEPGRFGRCYRITAGGRAPTIPATGAFDIDRQSDFTVEALVRPSSPKYAGRLVLVSHRARLDQPDSSGWLLALEPGKPTDGPPVAHPVFTVTDRAGRTVSAVGPDAAVPADWTQLAGVLDRAAGELRLYLDASVVATAPLGTLGDIGGCAAVGLGGDAFGAALMDGWLDEVRVSAIVRSDFLPPSSPQAGPYEADLDTVALYHLDETDDWIDEERGAHYAVNSGARRGVPARFGAGLGFAGGSLPPARGAAEREFQQRLRDGEWDSTAGGPQVSYGPYVRYAYRQGAIALPGLTGAPAPVLVNDDPAVPSAARGRVTTAGYGLVPAVLDDTVAAFEQAGRSAQEAVDYYGDWHGEPEQWYADTYAQHGITAAHEPIGAADTGAAVVRIPGDPAFALDATRSFTAEVIIRAEPHGDDQRTLLGTRPESPAGVRAGWSLGLGGYGGRPDNLRWLVADAAGTVVTVTADRNLADGRFHHVAGVVDRDAGMARLWLDGQEVGRTPLSPLGACTSADDILLGNGPDLASPYAGVLDEVRLSSAARQEFHPVLGESDDRYRLRLAIFQPWRLLAIDELRRAVRALTLSTTRATELLLSGGGTGELPEEGQLDLVEPDAVRSAASRSLRVLPERLLVGQSIDRTGAMPGDQSAAAGPPGPAQTELLLVHPDAPGLVFPNDGARVMALPAARALEAMLAILLPAAPDAAIGVLDGWTPDGDPWQATGRAVRIAPAGTDPRFTVAELAGLAHRCFAYVRIDPDSAVYACAAPGPQLDLAGPELVYLGAPATFSVARPALARPEQVSWELLRSGLGDAVIAPTGGSAELTPLAPGDLVLRVRYPLADGGTAEAARTIRIAPAALDGSAVLDRDGHTDATEAATVGPADPDFDPAFLVRAADPAFDYHDDAARQMQLPLERALAKLAAVLAAEPGAPRVTVLSAYRPGGALAESVGRGAVLAPGSPGLTAARLGALAFAAGLDYVERRRYPASVYVAVKPGERFEILRQPLRRLWQNARISGTGVLVTDESVAGPPDGGPVTPYTGPGVTFAPGVNNSVQTPLADALTALVAALRADGVPDGLTVPAGYTPGAADLTGDGRAVLLTHPAVPPDRLAGYCLAAGFGFVANRATDPRGPSVYAAAYGTGTGPPALDGPDGVRRGALTELAVRPAPPPGNRLDWSLRTCCHGTGVLGTALPDDPEITDQLPRVFRGTALGTLAVTAALSPSDRTMPYQCRVVRWSADAEPRLTKDQYDDIVNLLSTYRPVGIEVLSKDIRQYVHGFRRPPRWDEAPTAATFVPYRTQDSTLGRTT